MSSKLSGREKAMLYGLLLFLLAVGAVYLSILPAMARYSAAAAAVDAAQAAVDTAQMQLAQAQALAGQGAPGASGLAEQTGAVETDRLITGLLLDAGLEPMSLSLGEPGPVSVPAYGQPEDAEGVARGTGRAATAVATGSPEALSTLLDAVEAHGGLVITGVAYTQAPSGEATFDLTFALYTRSQP